MEALKKCSACVAQVCGCSRRMMSRIWQKLTKLKWQSHLCRSVWLKVPVWCHPLNTHWSVFNPLPLGLELTSTLPLCSSPAPPADPLGDIVEEPKEQEWDDRRPHSCDAKCQVTVLHPTFHRTTCCFEPLTLDESRSLQILETLLCC